MAEDTRRVGPECLGFRARLLSRVITAVYDDALAEVGLKVSQFSVLNAIASREEDATCRTGESSWNGQVDAQPQCRQPHISALLTSAQAIT